MASLVWLAPFTMWIVKEVAGRRARCLVLPGIVGCAFVALPPLTAFTLYFVVVHAPAHTLALVRHGTRVPRARSVAWAWALAAPATILTVLIGAALWPLYSGTLPIRLVCVTLQMLAAFTLPHMLLDDWLNRRDQIGKSQLPEGAGIFRDQVGSHRSVVTSVMLQRRLEVGRRAGRAEQSADRVREQVRGETTAHGQEECQNCAGIASQPAGECNTKI